MSDVRYDDDPLSGSRLILALYLHEMMNRVVIQEIANIDLKLANVKLQASVKELEATVVERDATVAELIEELSRAEGGEP